MDKKMVKTYPSYRGKRQEHGKLEQLKIAQAGWNPELGGGARAQRRGGKVWQPPDHTGLVNHGRS